MEQNFDDNPNFQQKYEKHFDKNYLFYHQHNIAVADWLKILLL